MLWLLAFPEMNITPCLLSRHRGLCSLAGFFFLLRHPLAKASLIAFFFRTVGSTAGHILDFQISCFVFKA